MVLFSRSLLFFNVLFYSGFQPVCVSGGCSGSLGEEGADIEHLSASARLCCSVQRRGAQIERGDGRRCRMRGLGGAIPGRGKAAHAGVGGGEPGEDPSCRVRLGRPGGEPGAETEVCRAGDRAGDSQEGVGTIAGGKWRFRCCGVLVISRKRSGSIQRRLSSCGLQGHQETC